MQQHITIVGALRIGSAIIELMVAGIVALFTVGPGLIAHCAEGNDEALAILTIIGVPIAFFFVMLALVDIVGGIGVLKHRNWTRYLVMIRSVLDIFNVPIGTAVGIYSIWVLAQNETARIFTQSPQQ